MCIITSNIKRIWVMVTCIIRNVFFFPFNLHVLDPESAPSSGSSGFIWKKQHYGETNDQEFMKDFDQILKLIFPYCFSRKSWLTWFFVADISVVEVLIESSLVVVDVLEVSEDACVSVKGSTNNVNHTIMNYSSMNGRSNSI